MQSAEVAEVAVVAKEEASRQNLPTAAHETYLAKGWRQRHMPPLSTQRVLAVQTQQRSRITFTALSQRDACLWRSILARASFPT